MALTNKPGFEDKRTKAKIDLHLRDINDKITEEDIENVRTDVTGQAEDATASIISAEQEADKILERKEMEDKDRDDQNNSKGIQTPWNMLD